MLNVIAMRKCTQCKETYPATREYFYYRSDDIDKTKFQSHCIFCFSKYNKKYHQENIEAIRIYREENKERNNASVREWQENNRDYFDEYHVGWHKKHPEKRLLYIKNRGEKKHILTGGEWLSCKNFFTNHEGIHCCAYCGRTLDEANAAGKKKKRLRRDFEKEHVDSYGANGLVNCVPACRSCNGRKWQFPLPTWFNQKNPRFSEERLERIYLWLTVECFNHIEQVVESQ